MNILTARTMQDFYVASSSILSHLISSFGTFYNFSPAISLLIILSLIGIFTQNTFEWRDKMHLTLIFVILFFYFYLFGSNLGRHLTAFLPLLYLGLAKEFRKIKHKNNFIYVSFVINIFLITFWIFLI